jgi:hypothetical protein
MLLLKVIFEFSDFYGSGLYFVGFVCLRNMGFPNSICFLKSISSSSFDYYYSLSMSKSSIELSVFKRLDSSSCWLWSSELSSLTSYNVFESLKNIISIIYSSLFKAAFSSPSIRVFLLRFFFISLYFCASYTCVGSSTFVIALNF